MVVFDVDEIVFLNWENMVCDDFGYVLECWYVWVEWVVVIVIELVWEMYLIVWCMGVVVIFLMG